MSRYLVTGATGFLGTHLVERLTALGHDVTALVRAPKGFAPRDRVTLAAGDVLDEAAVRAAAAGCDGLFHCAGMVSRDEADAEALYKIHVDGTKIVLDSGRAAGVRRAVVASTSGTVAVSRDPDKVIDERAPAPFDLVAGWPYYRSKLYAEKAALDRNGPGFEVVCVNPSLLLGPGDTRGSSTGDVVDFLEGKVPFVPAGGMSFVDVRDAAEAMRLAMNLGRAGDRYLVTGANMTIEAFFGRLSRISGVKMPRLRTPRSVTLATAGADLMKRAAKRFSFEAPVDRVSAEMSQHFWYVDDAKARAELGFTSRDAGETLADTVADLKDRGVVWPRV